MSNQAAIIDDLIQRNGELESQLKELKEECRSIMRRNAYLRSRVRLLYDKLTRPIAAKGKVRVQRIKSIPPASTCKSLESWQL